MIEIKRFPRERFTKSLAKLCHQLDGRHSVEFDYVPSRGAPVRVHGRLRATARVLWAFGSWAQGAPECRDLDLALDLAGEWVEGHGWLPGGFKARALPGFDSARKALLTAPAHVRIQDCGYIREHGPSGDFVVHPDALVPIWIAKDITDEERKFLGVVALATDAWRSRIEAVKEDPAYRRIARPIDVLPLQLEQTSMDLVQGERAVRAYAEGLISWEFLPHGSARNETTVLTPAEHRLSTAHDCNDDALVSRAIAVTRDLRRRQKPLFWYGNQCGIWPRMFEAWKASCIVITPRWSSVGPNGSLVVSKGPNYSPKAVEAFEAAEKLRR